MAENQKNNVTDENLPKPESVKKANKKLGVFIGILLVLYLVAMFTSELGGDIAEGIFLITALAAVVLGIVLLVKNYKHRLKG